MFRGGRIAYMQVRIRAEGGNAEAPVRILAGRERLLVLSGVAVMLVLGGAHLSDWSLGAAAEWSAGHGWLMFGMWAAMMVAVMVPAAVAPPALLAGHLALWTMISALAALAHWGLHAAGLLAPGASAANPAAGGMLLMAAGAYQLTPLKAACRAARRAPTPSSAADWQGGTAAAFVTGLRHATRCVGRCWLLMALMFVGGVMSPFWIVVLTLIAMAERILPHGETVAHGVAAGAIGWGLWMLVGMLV